MTFPETGGDPAAFLLRSNVRTDPLGVKHMQRWWRVALALAAFLALAGCAGKAGVETASADTQQVEVTAAGMAFAPKEIQVGKGKPVRLALVNRDHVLHDFSIAQMPATAKKASGDDHAHGKEPDIHIAANAGKTGVLEFTPTRPGDYTFYCTVAGHKEAGMAGTLTVS